MTLAFEAGSPARSNVHGNTKWTDEREQMLRAMFAEGQSFGEMAAAFGVGRGAISGKCDRLGLKRHTSRFTTEQLAERAQRRREIQREWRAKQREAAVWKPKPPALAQPDDEPAADFDCDDPTETACTINDLTGTRCAWPLWPKHPGLYCGRPIDDGARPQWCPAHSRRGHASRQ